MTDAKEIIEQVRNIYEHRVQQLESAKEQEVVRRREVWEKISALKEDLDKFQASSKERLKRLEEEAELTRKRYHEDAAMLTGFSGDIEAIKEDLESIDGKFTEIKEAQKTKSKRWWDVWGKLISWILGLLSAGVTFFLAKHFG